MKKYFLKMSLLAVLAFSCAQEKKTNVPQEWAEYLVIKADTNKQAIDTIYIKLTHEKFGP